MICVDEYCRMARAVFELPYKSGGADMDAFRNTTANDGSRPWRLLGRAAMVAALGVAMAVPAAADEHPIPIGLSLTQSPPGAVIQGEEVLRGHLIGRDIINEEGVLGRQIELHVQDSQGIPERGRAAVERLIERTGVVAISGQHQSSVCLAEIEVAHRHNIPYMNTNCWSDDVRTAGYEQVFSPNVYNSRVAEAMGEVIVQIEGIESIHALAENTDWGIGQAEALGAYLAEHASHISYRHDLLDREAEDFTPVVQRIRSDRPDMVVPILLPPAAYTLMNQLAEQGVVPSEDTWLFEGGSLYSYPDFWDNVRDAAINSIFFDLYHPEMPLSAFGERVRDEYIERYQGTPSRLVFQSADSILLLAEAMRAAGTTDADAVIAALQASEVEGSRGTITFATEPGILFQQWVDTPYVTFQVTELDQPLEETIFVSAPGVPVRSEDLVR
jgi:branched-chain amino acid transport system substrate-binding protein